MRRETIAIHGGYEVDPTTKSVAVPIYQTVAYAFDSADHGAALFNLEVEGLSLQPDQQPDQLPCWSGASPRWKAALEALCVSSGQAAMNYAVLNVTSSGATSSRCRSCTAPPTRCSLIFCPARA